MVALLVFGILMPLLAAGMTCLFVWWYIPPAVVKAIRESLHNDEGTRQ